MFRLSQSPMLRLPFIRGVLLAAIAVLTSISLAGVTSAQSNTTRIIVAFAAGGPVDTVARMLGERLEKELGRSVIIENKPGANGIVGANEVIRSAPDGTTLWLTSVGALAINPALYPKLPYDVARDFAPVSLVVNNVELLVVNPKNAAMTATTFADASKTSTAPVVMGSSGVGSIPHLAIEQFADATGAKLVHVPYRGAAPAISDVVAGHISGFFGDIPGLISFVREGQLKALGVASLKRHPAFPDLKTLDEQGIKGVDSNNWYAMVVSAKTPASVVDDLNKAIRKSLEDPALAKRLLDTGTEPAPSTSAELASLIARDTETWSTLIRTRNIKADP